MVVREMVVQIGSVGDVVTHLPHIIVNILLTNQDTCMT